MTEGREGVGEKNDKMRHDELTFFRVVYFLIDPMLELKNQIKLLKCHFLYFGEMLGSTVARSSTGVSQK